MSYRPLDFTIEIPELVDSPIATSVTDMGQKFIGVALDLTDHMVEGSYRIALTHDEASALHESLGSALKEMDR